MERFGRAFYWAACRIDTGRQVVGRPGGKGLFLIMFGLIYMLIGYSYTGNRPTHDLRSALHVPIELLPLWCWGVLWMTGGAATIVLGAGRRLRKVGFIVGSAVPAGWSVFYLFSWLTGDTTRGPVSFLVYLAFTVAVGIVAGLIDRNEVDPAATGPRPITGCA